ncbi:hypothetical protein [Flagellimonas meridianipacifica]|uniref:Outer membrane protein with beta-barrel domain n=1 Tax=Flagellimonas meridianipacifica TaxID=1080225 RepID=A0A2T0MHE7_9FLAO|nr:hypothetical protein [Allomuricauda pacifica]PRX57000.1 hypothetical protein CLV81_1001 [Allomuricauda pacifica]
MGKKNLEQLFKDTFQDFHESPDDNVWKSIEATLDKKKNKKRVIPIWWQLGGVAALFAILFFAINPLDSSKETDNNNQIQVVDTENKDESLPETKVIDSIKNSPQTTVASEEGDSVNESVSEDEEGSSNLNLNKSNSNGLASSDESVKEAKVTEGKEQSNPSSSLETAVAQNTNSTSEANNTQNPVNQILDDPENKTQDAVVAVDKQMQEEESLGILEKDGKESLNSQESEVAQADIEKKVEKELPEKKSIYDAIAEKNAEDEEELLAENRESKWAVGPSVAPVYFTGTGEGSPIHSNFSSNSKSGNVNLSYGLTVTYNLGKRLKVRSGVHRVDYGYDTNEVLFSSSLEGSTNELIDNINYTETSRNLVIQSSKSVPDRAAVDNFSEIQSNETSALSGEMVQQLGYIEVPLELNYALIDKKFGVDIIGGFSSLFLVDDTILLESDELVTEVGEANNANSINFSTNVGLGFNYKVSPKVQLNLEPMFKYQLNTFSETAGPFRPFSVGVYSGVSLKF